MNHIKKIVKKYFQKIRWFNQKRSRLVILGTLALFLIGGAFYFQGEIRTVLAKQAISSGNYYFNGGAYDLEKAEFWTRAALFLDPKPTYNIHYQLARIYFSKNEYPKALKEINTQLAANPSNQRAYYVRGLINGFLGNFNEAIRDFKKFVVWAPEGWAGYNDLSWAYYEAGQFKEAKEIAQRGLEKFPENTWLLNGLGAAEQGLKNYSEAEIWFKKAREAVKDLTVEEWRKAYLGDNPAASQASLQKFKDEIKYNLSLAVSDSGKQAIFASACYEVYPHQCGWGYMTGRCVPTPCMSENPWGYGDCESTCSSDADCGCTVTSCNAPEPSCGQTTYGTDNCGNSCSKTGQPCPCPVTSCNAPEPACGQTTSGTDCGGNSCSKIGPPCPPFNPTHKVCNSFGQCVTVECGNPSDCPSTCSINADCPPEPCPSNCELSNPPGARECDPYDRRKIRWCAFTNGGCNQWQYHQCDLCQGMFSCGNEDDFCFNNACCHPSCDNKQCGSDGCGGSCGSCPPGQYCSNNQCVAVACTVSISASRPNPVPYGQATTITWSSTYAVGLCTATGGSTYWAGVWNSSGSWISGALTQAYTYIMTCYNSAGTPCSGSVPVNVGTPPPTVNLKANDSNVPIPIDYNTAANLSWTSENATSCIASGGWSGSKSTSGSESTGNLISSKTYTLTCTGTGGSASDSVTVNVTSPSACTVSISANPNPVPYGQATTITWSSTNVSGLCMASGGSYGWSTGAKNPSGNWPSSALTLSSTYILTCYNSSSTPCSGSVPVGITNYSCQGNVPANNATKCEGSDTGLTNNTTSWTNDPDCTGKCKFKCDIGYVYRNGSCVHITYSWQISDWSDCSPTCGEGTKTRSVWCATNDTDLTPVDDEYCTGTKPLASDFCNDGACPTTNKWKEVTP